jgi:NAD(P)-dependent dehydrogenase (short-subunit alcohol dehydrogenase family)
MPNAATDAWADFEVNYPEAASEYVARLPLRRMGSPDEIARVIAFLAGPDAGLITGSVVKVDGGFAP